MTSGQLETYLIRLGRELRKRGLVDDRIVEEARGHLVDAIEHGLQRGLSVDAAEHEAFARFGAPEAVAAQFVTERYRLLNRWLLVAASVVGMIIAYVDSRPTWDDAGIAAFSMLVSAGVFGMIGPQRPWLWALAIGIWIPLHAFARTVSLDSIGMLAVIAFPLAGAYAGMAVRRVLAASMPARELFALHARSGGYHEVRFREFRVRAKAAAFKGMVNPGLNAADAREQLAQFLGNPHMLGRMGALESLTLLEDTTDSPRHVRRYLAAFAGGAKMIWTVVQGSDGTVLSIDGTNAP
jgi:hypothetical protein